MGLLRRHLERPADSIVGSDEQKEVKTPDKWRVIRRRGGTVPAIQTSTFVVLFIMAVCNRLNRLVPCWCWTASQEASDFRARPISVQTIIEDNVLSVRQLQLEADPAHLIQKRRNKHWINHPLQEQKTRMELKEGCEHLGDWMTEMHPSCNDFHEVDMTDFFMNQNRTFVRVEGRKRRKKMFHIARGGFRHAFMVTDFDGSRRVLKTIRYSENRKLGERNFDKMRRDAVASEQLTSSPLIADIYGYCAYSALVDYSNEDDMLSIFDQDEQPTKDELFQIAYDVASSVADFHHTNADGRATMVHMDIKPNQWIMLNGTYVLNDFNLARFLTWSPERHENCGRATGWPGGRWEAPEQYTHTGPLTEKADDYSLGAVLYFLLTKHHPFPGKKRPEITEILRNGGVLKLDDPKVLKSTHPFDVTVRNVVKKLLNIDPQKRPSAREAADTIGRGLFEYQNPESSSSYDE